ncbi:MAG: hypothetical protein AAGU21_06535 [Solidesulfovibrio sp.]|uniref:ORC-CDC6 family AAA ATPase n=1 Tax=Solidesulfovibrio sp. TaxID=2910990 RepID=UPI0031587257
MERAPNPFEYEAAYNLPDETIFEVFIPDHNYTRFLQSKRNFFLLGERGSGKSISLLYSSMKVQRLNVDMQSNLEHVGVVGIYVPCMNPLYDKKEFELFDDNVKSIVLSQHLFVLHLAQSLVESLSLLGDFFSLEEERLIFNEIEYVLNIKLFRDVGVLKSLSLYLDRMSCSVQSDINSQLDQNIDQVSYNFSSLVLPLIKIFRSSSKLAQAHFNFLIDDANELNIYQQRALNSLISYRDHTLFSFKVAIPSFYDYSFNTLSKGEILEGHDYVLIDLEREYQSKLSPYGQFAREVVKTRLDRLGINLNPEDFFPFSPSLISGMESAKDKAKIIATKEEGYADTKQIADYVYKQHRAIYFRDRASKANLPPYSGFETIVHASTGIIRNLLLPCYWMYDMACSEARVRGKPCTEIYEISPRIQKEILVDRSKELWDSFGNLSTCIEGCDSESQNKLYNLFDQLGVLFRKRLLNHKSEPRAITFTISGLTDYYEKRIFPLLEIARKARLLYFREGPSKDDGKRERYYVPNRLLWIVRGLDPVGQFARVSIAAKNILAATEGKPIPLSRSAKTESQGSLCQI